MKRIALTFLQDWLLSPPYKPLVVRGARQVGKTWLIRYLAEVNHKQLIELNFEKNPEYKHYFSSNDPKIILRYLEAALSITIDPKNCILFLDEVQAVPELISKLRWFGEDLAQLPVIAAGSLLEFTLANYAYSMPVGRIEYLHLEPFSFEEFLLALGKEKLYDLLNTVTLKEIDYYFNPLHDQLMSLFKDYLIVGGMPAAVASWIKHEKLDEVGKIHHNLLATYRDDFHKYSGKLDNSRLEDVLNAIPKLVGKKFTYAHVNREVQTAPLKSALDLLIKAKLCSRVVACGANGIPIGAEIKHNQFKIILLDVGLLNSLLGLKLHNLINTEEILLINNGAVAEQVTGQLLRTIEPAYIDPTLYYWVRAENSSSSEVDYIIQQQTHIIPIEVKAGSTGHLRSLHVLMALKKLKRAVRINADLPSKVEINVDTSINIKAHYTLISLPFYLLGQLPRLLTIRD